MTSNIASHRYEMYSALCGYMGALSFGYTVGYSSPALPQMTATERIMHNNEDAASWFGSIATLGAMLGCVIGGDLVERKGRRWTLMATSFPFFFGWLVIAVGSEVEFLCFGRFLTGVGSGMVCVAAPLYITETAPRELRGTLGAGVQLSVTIGILTVYCLGLFLSWRDLAIVGAAAPIIGLLISLRVAESPRWLLSAGRRTDAINVLVWLRGTSAIGENEFHEMEKRSAELTDRALLSEIVSRPELARPFFVVLGVMALQQCTGINAVMFYTVSIFQAAGFRESGGAATVLIGIVQVMSTVVACAVMDTQGRRKMLIIAGLGMALSCGTLGVYYNMSSADATPSANLGWLALASLIGYIVAFSLGWGPVPMLLMSEVLPARARGTASGAATLVNWALAFVVTKFFGSLQATAGLDGSFWLFGIACLLAVTFVARHVPETKGRSLEEIEQFFGSRAII